MGVHYLTASYRLHLLLVPNYWTQRLAFADFYGAKLYSPACDELCSPIPASVAVHVHLSSEGLDSEVRISVET